MEDYICEVCSRKMLVSSQIKLSAGYGSIYDGESISLSVCPACFDAVISCLGQRAGGDTVAVE